MYMKTFITLITIITTALLGTACSKKESSVETDQAVINKEHVLSKQKKAVDQAKQVEQMLIDGQNSRHNAM